MKQISWKSLNSTKSAKFVALVKKLLYSNSYDSPMDYGTTTFEQNNRIIESIYKGGSRLWRFIYDSTRERKAKAKEIFVFIYMLSFKSSTLGNGLWFGCRLFLNALNRMINRRRV